MPSTKSIPKLAELVEAFRSGVRAEDPREDLHDGSIYDVWGGVGAILFQREARADQARFRSTYVDFADGDDLDAVLQTRFLTNREGNTASSGYAVLTRPTAAAGDGSFYLGTRIEVIPEGNSEPKYYRILATTPVTGGALTASPPVEADEPGAGNEFSTATAPYRLLRFEDAIWDNSWTFSSMWCSGGANREKDPEARARVRQDRIDARAGYALSVTNACVSGGAVQVALFSSEFLGTNPSTNIETIGDLDEDGYGDVGINFAFVGDADYEADAALLSSCRYKVDSSAVCGTNVQVQAMTKVSVSVTIELSLWKDPGNFAKQTLAKQAQHAVTEYFDSRDNAFYFRHAAIRGAVLKAVREVQSMTISTTPAEPTLTTLFSTMPLQRFFVEDANVTVTVTGPE